MTDPTKNCGAKTTTCDTCGCHRRQHRKTDDGRGACACGKCSWFVARPCRVQLVGANGRCRLHGARALSGLAHPNLKSGAHSKHRYLVSLGRHLGKRFDAAMKDPALTECRHLIALNDALITSFLARLKKRKGPLTERQEARILTLLDAQRKLILAESARQRDLSLFVTAEQFRAFTDLMLSLFIEFVPDLGQRMEIQRRVQAHLATVRQVSEDELADEEKD